MSNLSSQLRYSTGKSQALHFFYITFILFTFTFTYTLITRNEIIPCLLYALSPRFKYNFILTSTCPQLFFECILFLFFLGLVVDLVNWC